MSMFKKLKSIFIIEDDPRPRRQKSVRSESPDQSPKTNESAGGSGEMPEADMSGPPSERFLKVLLGAMEKGNLEGFDYLEYKQSLKSLNSMDMEEATQFQSSFAVAKTMGATKQLLIRSAEHYKGILVEEESKFKEALKKQHRKQIEGNKMQIEQLMQLIGDKKKQISQLEKEISEAETKIRTRQVKLDQSSSKLEEMQADFYNTYQTLLGQIEEDIQKMNRYLS
jgi:hypothetical protein